MNGTILQTVVETPEFIKQANMCMTDESRLNFIKYIAENPQEGDLIVGAGGARKIRWQASSTEGKRGGARIIYYYHDQDKPIFLFAAYKKNQKDNITVLEKKMLKKIINLLVEKYEVIDD